MYLFLTVFTQLPSIQTKVCCAWRAAKWYLNKSTARSHLLRINPKTPLCNFLNFLTSTANSWLKNWINQLDYLCVCFQPLGSRQFVEWARIWVLAIRPQGWLQNQWTPPLPPWLLQPQAVCQVRGLRAKTLPSAATARLFPHQVLLAPENQQPWAICRATVLAAPRHTTTPGACNHHSRAQTGGWTAPLALAPAQQEDPIHPNRTLCCHPGTEVVLEGQAALV